MPFRCLPSSVPWYLGAHHRSSSIGTRMPDKPQTKIEPNDPAAFINRELSWIEFNNRVLEEGLSPSTPPLDRLKFLSIVSSNFDEFFMIRVAGLKQQVAAGLDRRDPAGLTAAEQLREISRRVHESVARQSDGIRKAAARLQESGVEFVGPKALTPAQSAHLAQHFAAEVLPLLTPLSVAELDPFPTLPGRVLNLAVLLQPTEKDAANATIAVVPVPRILPRFIALPGDKPLRLVAVEDVIRPNIARLFPGMHVAATALFRLTRDADVSVEDESARDLLIVMEEAVRARRRRDVVRLELSAAPDARIRKWLVEWCRLGEEDLYEVDGLLDPSDLMEAALRPGLDALREPPWPCQPPRDLLGIEDLWTALRDRDVLLLHPYECFDPVVRLVQEAADDAGVLAIKQTLYRTSGDSPIIAALARAAEKGKQVTVLVELKARFDESRNIAWARRLEDAGCQVIYGIAGYKTHAKALLILRREPKGLRRYLHLSTGNYNDRTARLYSDIGFMTTDKDLAGDAAAFFNLLTGVSQEVGWRKFAIAPTGLRQRVIDLIEREAQASSPDQPGLIAAKMNSLEDPAVIQALYRAARAGVRIQLNVRGICCLRPGVPGLSENIEVVSIVDRYLEHARLFHFRNGGHEEVYLSSADWMGRNLDRRLEILFPVGGDAHRKRLIELLQTYFTDGVKARVLQPDGSYARAKRKGKQLRAQEQLHRESVDAAKQPTATEFRPITRPAGEEGKG
jgi:polyphosphate kinase